MNRRDLELISGVIRNLPLADERRQAVAISFADSFAAQHVKHDRWKFLQACGCLSAVLEASIAQEGNKS